MAGSYADVPGPKMMYDMDGSVGVIINASNAITTLTSAQLIAGNDESHATTKAIGNSGTCKMCVIFPQLRDVVGHFMGIWNQSGTGSGNNRDDTGTGTFSVETSADTTNGVDGSWTSRASGLSRPSAYASYSMVTERTGITTVSWTGVKAVRYVTAFLFGPIPEWDNIHFYGSIASGQTPDRLRLWHPTLDQELTAAYFDYGDQVRGAVVDKTFRVKNNSSTLTANNTVLAVSALTDTTPTVVGQFTISQGAAYAATQTITAIAPGAISAVCTLRYTVAAGASLSVWRQRVTATPTSWS